MWVKCGTLEIENETVKLFLDGIYFINLNSVCDVVKEKLGYCLIYEKTGKCGYVALTKSKEFLLILLKTKRYTADLKRTKMVLEGQEKLVWVKKRLENAKNNKK